MRPKRDSDLPPLPPDARAMEQRTRRRAALITVRRAVFDGSIRELLSRAPRQSHDRLHGADASRRRGLCSRSLTVRLSLLHVLVNSAVRGWAKRAPATTVVSVRCSSRSHRARLPRGPRAGSMAGALPLPRSSHPKLPSSPKADVGRSPETALCSSLGVVQAAARAVRVCLSTTVQR
jgi:hypothetical protein